MEYINDTNITQSVPTVVTLGNFDGLHQGHQVLIRLTQQIAEQNGLKSVVFSFFPHPMQLFSKTMFQTILSPEEKRFLIEEMGVSLLVEYPFSQVFADLPPEEFVRKILFQEMRCHTIVVGEDYRFGKNGAGDAALLARIGKEGGVDVITVPFVRYEGEKVSSTAIRQALAEGNLKRANGMLGSAYFVRGVVTGGKQLGRTIGFPTANVTAPPMKLFPPNGVYATRSLIDGEWYVGVTNVGHNPTVQGIKKTVETNLFDFSEDIYGHTIQTFFYEFLRPEQKFSSVEELRRKIAENVMQSKTYFTQQNGKERKNI